VTGIARFWLSQIWVMPTFSPTIALVATFSSSSSFLCVDQGRHTDAPPGHENPNGALDWVGSAFHKGN
jgi:hypothetical protein